jgi:hypothetical protein
MESACGDELEALLRRGMKIGGISHRVFIHGGRVKGR